MKTTDDANCFNIEDLKHIQEEERAAAKKDYDDFLSTLDEEEFNKMNRKSFDEWYQEFLNETPFEKWVKKQPELKGCELARVDLSKLVTNVTAKDLQDYPSKYQQEIAKDYEKTIPKGFIKETLFMNDDIHVLFRIDDEDVDGSWIRLSKKMHHINDGEEINEDF